MNAHTDISSRYVDEERIAVGGMASVWRSYDRDTGGEVAIKRLHPHLAEARAAVERFEREIEIAASLEHPGIPRVLDSGADEYGPYMVMELIHGETVRRRIDDHGPLAWTEAQRIATAVAGILAHAHEHHILHRDIKPENIMLERGTGKVVLVDFGIANSDDFERRFTSEGGAIGTADYLAPERALGQPGSVGSDLYSLGVVFFEMVTGMKPFHGDNALAIAVAHQTQRPPAPSRFVELPHTVESVILRALAKAPRDRFDSAEDFIIALSHAAAATQPFPVIDPPRRFRNWLTSLRRPHKSLKGPAYAAVGSLGTYVVGWLAF